MRMYLTDSDYRFPPYMTSPKGWTKFVEPRIKSIKYFRCPSAAIADRHSDVDYFYNRQLSGLEDLNEPFYSQTIMFGDGKRVEGRSAYLNDLPSDWIADSHSPFRRHLGGANYAFVDGHVKWLKIEDVRFKSPRNTVVARSAHFGSYWLK